MSLETKQVSAYIQNIMGTSLVVQWLRFHASTAGGTGSILDWGTKTRKLHGQKKKKNPKQSIT